ncbi:hypothetical protein D3C71_2057200 [compost metagenome]
MLRDFSGLRSSAPRALANGESTRTVLASTNCDTPLTVVYWLAVWAYTDCDSDGARKPLLSVPRRAKVGVKS